MARRPLTQHRLHIAAMLEAQRARSGSFDRPRDPPARFIEFGQQIGAVAIGEDQAVRGSKSIGAKTRPLCRASDQMLELRDARSWRIQLGSELLKRRAMIESQCRDPGRRRPASSGSMQSVK